MNMEGHELGRAFDKMATCFRAAAARFEEAATSARHGDADGVVIKMSEGSAAARDGTRMLLVDVIGLPDPEAIIAQLRMAQALMPQPKMCAS